MAHNRAIGISNNTKTYIYLMRHEFADFSATFVLSFILNLLKNQQIIMFPGLFSVRYIRRLGCNITLLRVRLIGSHIIHLRISVDSRLRLHCSLCLLYWL